MNKNKVIHGISGPRNISTALMYSFAQRPNCEVIDEPFYAYYLNKTGLNHPLREKVIASQSINWDEIVSQLNGDIPKEKANDLGIIVSVWLNPSVIEDDNLDHKILFDIHRKATAQAIHKAMKNEPSIDWLLDNQESIVHKYYQMGLDGKI